MTVIPETAQPLSGTQGCAPEPLGPGSPLCGVHPGLAAPAARPGGRDDKSEAATTDVFSPEKRSAVMARIRGKNTGPELKLRRLLHAAGYRYRLHAPGLPGRPDLAFSRRRAAVFVHGCFWHGHHCGRGARIPKANAAYWSAKIARNRARDAEVCARLEAAGWSAHTVWECELKAPAAVLARLRGELGPPHAASVSAASPPPSTASARAR